MAGPNIDKSPGMQQQLKGLFGSYWPIAQEQALGMGGMGDMISSDLGVSPLTQMGLDRIQEESDYVTPGIRNVQREYMESLNPQDVANNPQVLGILESLQRQSGDLFNEQIAPTIRRDSIGGGMFGGGRSGVGMGIGAGKAADAYNDAAAKTMLGAYQLGEQQRTNRLGMAPTMANLGMMPGQSLVNAGLTDMQQRQAQAQSEMARQQGLMDMTYSPLRNMASSHASAFGSQVPAQTGGASTMANIIGGASMALPLLGGMFGGPSGGIMGGQMGAGGMGPPTPGIWDKITGWW